uniref:Amino acid/amide ABC transporter membrane protein 1, HAAT family n=1 Tax=Candidatus Kentrum sp. LFY TaxID=2126342 RepID=A0A450V4K5_9GAMM|nr:MAG: amino acid/amide ABC transporter membrane protein 1, HAAT family [Candidatus Kentron sp. LFY]VFJ99723.1 MAG: amino acid/amide ABC transporter membrane protein 1, HAAT family [Candidatus Kentron sp. LFY]VFK15126.1 MAG: amino acid/amide ABC transporter membrane protein 1, HAAT family [Candidatus Kentron sp. LFY]
MELFELSFLTQLLISGLLAGTLYGLIACGLNLVFGVMRVINVAHAELMLIGAYLAYVLYTFFGLHPLASLALVIPVLFGFGWFLQRLLIERVVGQHELSSLILTYGLSIVLMNIGLVIFSADFKSIPALQGAITISDAIVIPKARGIAGLVTIVITLGVYLFLKETRSGKAIRAVSEHPHVAAICGIDVVRTRMLTFGISTAMAGAAGVMLATIYSFSPETGADFILKCFAIIIIGGMGSFTGAFIGSILLGVAEAFVAGFIATQWSEVVAYSLLVLVLLIRPTGLRGIAHAR